MITWLNYIENCVISGEFSRAKQWHHRSSKRCIANLNWNEHYEQMYGNYWYSKKEKKNFTRLKGELWNEISIENTYYIKIELNFYKWVNIYAGIIWYIYLGADKIASALEGSLFSNFSALRWAFKSVGLEADGSILSSDSLGFLLSLDVTFFLMSFLLSPEILYKYTCSYLYVPKLGNFVIITFYI